MIARVLALLVLAACAPQGGAPAFSTMSSGAMPADSVNMVRRAAGLPAVRSSARAEGVARRHAEDLARSGRNGHRGSDGSTHAQRLRAAGCGRGVENVAWGMASDRDAVAAWMTSKEHRRNVLWPEARVYGLARAGDRWVLVLAEGC